VIRRSKQSSFSNFVKRLETHVSIMVTVPFIRPVCIAYTPLFTAGTAITEEGENVLPGPPGAFTQAGLANSVTGPDRRGNRSHRVGCFANW
jgi:hypothetical protein